MSSSQFEVRQQSRVEEAKFRQAASGQLTPEARLADLDRRLGKGVGAAKERARLQKLIKAPVPAAAPAKVQTVPVVAVGRVEPDQPSLGELHKKLDEARERQDSKAERAVLRRIRRAEARKAGSAGGGTGTGG